MLAEMGIRLWFPQPDPLRGGHRSPATSPLREGGAPLSRRRTGHRPHQGRARAAVIPMPARHRPAGVESMDWPALRAAVAACTACGLCESRRQTVFGVGHEQAHWMIVGEAPGEQEDRQGEPFVGKAGQVARQHAACDRAHARAGTGRAAGVHREHAEVPAAGQPQPRAARDGAVRAVPRAPGGAACSRASSWRWAASRCSRCCAASEPVGRLRGRVHAYHGVPLIVTYHPAYLLRNLEDKARSWDDLCLARDVLGGRKA